MSHPFHRRLVKEYKELMTHPLAGLSLLTKSDELNEFVFAMEISQDNPLYKDKTFRLMIKIGEGYPVEPLAAKFLRVDSHNVEVPVHPHIYSNGHICLNLLGTDWSPACTIETILLSLQSMLAHNTANERPPDDERYTRSAPAFASRTGFVYHDNNV